MTCRFRTGDIVTRKQGAPGDAFIHGVNYFIVDSQILSTQFEGKKELLWLRDFGTYGKYNKCYFIADHFELVHRGSLKDDFDQTLEE